MKIIHFVICAIVLILVPRFGAQAQMTAPQDTSLGNTETAAKAALWLRNLALPTGTGGIGALSGFSAQALISDSSRQYADKNGMVAYYASSFFTQDLRNLRGKVLQRIVFMRKIGVLAARDPALFSWGVLEPVKGSYNFMLLDSLIKIAGEYGVPFVGTVVPFSDWASSCNTDKTSTCSNLFASGSGADYFFINQGKTGPVCDTAAFYTFVQKLVERYDGDGIDDMPSLKTPISYWEFANEPDGPCGGYGDDKPFMAGVTPKSLPGLYSRDHSIMFRAMKNACPTCQLANGGSLESFDVPFWNSVLDTLAPNKRLMDIANVHVNVGKTASPARWDWGIDFYRYVNIFLTNIKKQRVSMPMWMTEWGFYSGAPTQTSMNGTVTTLPNRTEEEQAAIHVKFYAWGKVYNLTTFFYDLQGSAGSGLGSAGLVESGMGGNKARLLYHSLRLYEYKFRTADSAQQITFSTSSNLSLPQGHIRIFKRGVASDVLWGLTALPNGITGRKVRTDLYGNTDTLDAAQIQFPLGSNPIILENVQTMSAVWEMNPLESVRIAPNPASQLVRVQGYCSTPSSLTLSLCNLLGQETMRLPAEWTMGEFAREIDVSHLPQGSYFLRLQTGTSFITKPVQVLR
ncbi:MAG: T9SS type A sorting domain-containing protein [Candidatus Kapabacteria bacterium]|nr:T9SS type A sorting domain-containing protein [Candidatus Kapabacteria bacterium]